MRKIISHTLCYLGEAVDFISRNVFRGYIGYTFYNWLMVKSHEIQGDTEEGPWRAPTLEQLAEWNSIGEEETGGRNGDERN